MKFIYLLFVLLLVKSSLSDEVRCLSIKQSTMGQAIQCQSNAPPYLNVIVTLKLKTSVAWKGADSWSFYKTSIFDPDRLIQLGFCQGGQSAVRDYAIGETITIAVNCRDVNLLPS